MLGGWQAQWAEQGLGVWWNVPKFCPLLLLPGSLTLLCCCTTFPFQSIQIYPNKRWLQSEMSTHSGSWGDLWAHPRLCQNLGLGRERMSWLWRSGSGMGNGRIQKSVLNPQKAASLVPATHSGSPRGVLRRPCPEVGALLTMINV